jgi:AcrR family transcriptional regulator
VAGERLLTNSNRRIAVNFFIKRKERIILTAIDIINELGFQGLSTKEICRREEVSEGALYKHYQSKDEVILAVLDYYSRFDDDIKQTVEMKKLSAKEGITYFIARFAEYYENYPAMTSILNSYEVLIHEAYAAHKVEGIFNSRSQYITGLIEKGIKEGEIRNDIDSKSLSDIILGSCHFVALKWRMQGFSFPLKEKILFAHSYIMKSC